MYPALEEQEAELPSDLKIAGSREPLKMDDDDRVPRTIDEMIEEAEWLKAYFVT